MSSHNALEFRRTARAWSNDGIGFNPLAGLPESLQNGHAVPEMDMCLCAQDIKLAPGVKSYTEDGRTHTRWGCYPEVHPALVESVTDRAAGENIRSSYELGFDMIADAMNIMGMDTKLNTSDRKLANMVITILTAMVPAGIGEGKS